MKAQLLLQFGIALCFLCISFFITTGIVDTPQLTVVVTLAQPLPDGQRLFITGNQEKLGNWNPSVVPMEKKNDTTWLFTGAFPAFSEIEMKVTRGSWAAEALERDGTIPDNIRQRLFSSTAVGVKITGWKDMPDSLITGITGDVRYHRALSNPMLVLAPRDVIVWLPPSYNSDLLKRYPVLYMHDGQNIIDPSTSFIGYDWHADETADSLIRQGKLKEIIIVGIYNTAFRTSEYSDSDSGRAYAQFVITTLKPMLDASYRTLPGRENTGVIGSSMGGLISFLFVWWHPEVFSMAGCLSGAFLYDGNKILSEVREYAGGKKNLRFYLDNGGIGLEGLLNPGIDEMVSLLKTKGYATRRELSSFYDPLAVHNERAWAKRLWRPLMFMFGNVEK